MNWKIEAMQFQAKLGGSKERTREWGGAWLDVAVFTFAAAAFLLALLLYKYWGRFLELTTRQAALVAAPTVMLLLSGAFVRRAYQRSKPSNRRIFLAAVAANLVLLTILVAAAEAVVRMLTVSTPLGQSVAGIPLLPRSWVRYSARNNQLLEDSPANISYFVSDPLLGWTVGAGRTSRDGLYSSSAEGIRSPRSDMSYADRRASQHIVTVGDSFTFGLETPFENTWQFQLERALGGDVDVLNFGVDGYGVDQAYLRYDRDARPWRPVLAIFGFIQHDLRRSLSVYSFISFPEWGFPFGKPRFALRRGKLELLNVPIATPSEIAAVRSVTELPFITEDPGYHSIEWEEHVFYTSRLIRYLLSRFPRRPVGNSALGVETEVALNSELLLSFVQRATADGTVPVVAYFPTRSDFHGSDHAAKDGVVSALKGAGVSFVDLTACIQQVGKEEAFLKGRPHYSAAGNAAVARCLLPTLQRELQRTSTVADSAR